MKQIALALLLALAAPLTARAACQPIPITTNGTTAFTSVSIAAGAVTTYGFPINPYTQILIRATVTDASDGITNIRYKITESSTLTGTYGPYCEATVAAGVYTCEWRQLDWNHTDAQEGKEARIELPATGRFWKITATPTGHGASDAITITAEGCT